MDKLHPQAKRQFAVATLLLIIVPLAVLYTVRWYMAGSRHEILATGFSAVAAVNVVVFFIIRSIYRDEYNKED
jgi:membrane protein YdbS with pleckstrin-like domain